MKQFLVVGLGNFGYYLATHLYQKGHDVMAIDKDPALVQNIKASVTRAVVADATDPAVMKELAVNQMDTAVVSIGSVLGDSVLTVLNLQEAGVSNIVAKAINEPHKRILEKLGVHDVSFPEKDMALSMAARLDNPNLIDYLPFLAGYGIIELAVPKPFIGQSLKQINLTNTYNVQVVAIKELVPERMRFIPTADFVLKSSDILILLGSDTGLEKLKLI